MLHALGVVVMNVVVGSTDVVVSSTVVVVVGCAVVCTVVVVPLAVVVSSAVVVVTVFAIHSFKYEKSVFARGLKFTRRAQFNLILCSKCRCIFELI